MKKLIIFFTISIFIVSVSYSQMTEQWIARYNGPGNSSDNATSIAVDGSGNVYVTGSSYGGGTSYDYATIKYNSAGVQQWAAIYNGPGNGADSAFSIAVDNSGNVYVTGKSVGSGTSYDYATIKYNSAGVQQWAARYNGPVNGDDVPTSIAVDGTGNVYVTGESVGSGTSNDYVTIKYNSSGVQQWVQRYNGPGNGDDIAHSLAIDSLGNVYVTGGSYINVTVRGYATIKYNSAGVQQWIAMYNGPVNNLDFAYSLAVDGSGNVYVTGASYGNGTYYDYATIKYNSAGVQQWVSRYNGLGNGDNAAISLAVDGSGNVYVTGESAGSGTSYDYATIKYNSAGVQQWAARYNGPGIGANVAYSLVLDGSGNVYVTGVSAGSTSYDYATIKYNSAGVQQWVQRYNGPGNGDDIANSIAVDGSGNVYVTGGSYGSGTSSDYATIKYSPAAVFSTQFKHNNLNKPITDNQSTIDTISVNYTDQSGYTVLDVNLNIDTVIHTNDGDLEFYLIHNGITDTVVYQAGGSGHNLIGTVLNDSSSTLITNGTAPFTGMYRPVKPLSQFNNLDIDGAWILKIYDRTTGNTGILEAWSLNFVVNNGIIGIQPVGNVIPKQFSLSQNYPNPFNPSTNIHFAIPKSAFVKITVLDILGREIETIVDEKLSAGTYNADWDASKYSSGVYFYKLVVAGEFGETKRMILVK